MSNTRKRLDGHQLFYKPTCFYCIQVLYSLSSMGFELPLKNILFHPKYKTELITGGGKKQVPCLRIEDKNGGVQWLYESRDIIRYLKRLLSG